MFAGGQDRDRDHGGKDCEETITCEKQITRIYTHAHTDTNKTHTHRHTQTHRHTDTQTHRHKKKSYAEKNHACDSCGAPRPLAHSSAPLIFPLYFFFDLLLIHLFVDVGAQPRTSCFPRCIPLYIYIYIYCLFIFSFICSLAPLISMQKRRII